MFPALLVKRANKAFRWFYISCTPMWFRYKMIELTNLWTDERTHSSADPASYLDASALQIGLSMTFKFFSSVCQSRVLILRLTWPRYLAILKIWLGFSRFVRYDFALSCSQQHTLTFYVIQFYQRLLIYITRCSLRVAVLHSSRLLTRTYLTQKKLKH